MFTAIHSKVNTLHQKVFKMLSVYNVAMVGEFEFVKKSPSNDIIKESRRMQGSLIPLNYHFACLKLPQPNCYVHNCEEKFRLCFVTKEVKLMRRLEISLFLLIDPD